MRSAAALAAGRCAAAFPAEAEPWRAELWPLLRGALDDNVPSVRGEAAVALADAVRAWGSPMLDLLLPALRCVSFASEASAHAYDLGSFKQNPGFQL